MPTASGRPTADEKREADRIKQRAARLAVTALVAAPEWYEAEADSFIADRNAHLEGQRQGTIPTYHRYERWYPAGEEHKVGRILVDEGRARSYGVYGALEARGIECHTMMSFRLFEGRSGLQYAVMAR